MVVGPEDSLRVRSPRRVVSHRAETHREPCAVRDHRRGGCPDREGRAAGRRVDIRRLRGETFFHLTLTAGAAGWTSSLTSGAGFVCRFQGPGTIYVQTRSPAAFAGWLSRYIPSRS